KATSLKAVTLPSKGGDTRFVNMRRSYDDLPDDRKRRIEPLRTLRVFKSSRSPRKKVELTPEERARLPETIQPLVLVHPENGRKAAYLNTAHIERVIGLDDDEGFALIDYL